MLISMKNPVFDLVDVPINIKEVEDPSILESKSDLILFISKDFYNGKKEEYIGRLKLGVFMLLMSIFVAVIVYSIRK